MNSAQTKQTKVNEMDNEQTNKKKKRNPKQDVIDKRFEFLYDAMDIRPGIRAHAKEIARAAFKQGFNYGVNCERAKG